MGVRAAVVVVVMVLGVVVTRVVAASQDDITLTTGGYSGVVVAMSDQLDPNKCTEYVEKTKAMFEAASQLMFTATGSKVFFGEVVIAVPETWACTGNTFNSSSRTYSWDSAHLRVGPAHPVFGNNPWTQQPGGCGDPGDWIYMSENFVLGNTSYGSPGSVLVHEWAKYRWGVFEEYGHTSDLIYPPAYLNQSNEMVPTYCTDQPVEGVLSCNGGLEFECQFTPELTANSTATSSLLAAPFLNTVVNFCDNNSHNTAAPTKQNLLCDQSSAWDVMNRHSDMQGAQGSLTNTNFNLVYEGAAGPRLVLLLDYSAVMGMTPGRWEYLRDNVVQYIMLEAAADNYVGVVVFGGSTSINYYPLLQLSDYTNREMLAKIIPLTPPDDTSASDKDLFSALSRGSLLLGVDGGTMVLVTHNMEEYTTTQNLTEAANNNAVWPILYPCDSTVSKAVYDKLADISPDTSVLTVVDGIYEFGGIQYQSIQNSADLHRSLITAFANPATGVTSGSCNEVTCNFNLEMTDSTDYISTAYIKVFHGSDEPSSMAVTVKPPGGGDDITGTFNGTCALFQISTLEAGQYVVSVSGSFSGTSVVGELWATPATPLGLQVSVWSSQGLNDLQSLPGSPPTLFAKVTDGASMPVLFAEITGQVTAKGTVAAPGNITLNDAGFGGDVTGNDGIYTGYLVGFEPNTDVSISLTVTDNNGAARVVKSSARTAPTTQETNTCCGSQLDVSLLQLDVLENFTLSSAAVSGRLTGMSAGTLPPGRVRDLQASSTGWDVTLTFTAPGGQLDQGTADLYERKFQADGEEAHVANITGQPVGSRVEVNDKLPDCDKVYTMTVEAITGEVRGGASNSARGIVSCNYKPPQNLTGGQIAGITIGCILGVLLIVLIIYLCLNRDHLDELWVWYILTCGCFRKKEEDLYKQPEQARRTDVIRTNTSTAKPVRNLSDLYALPKLTGKSKQNKAEDQDDGGFGERSRRQENAQRRAPEDVESVASSHSNLPINQVGLPVGGDNHGYDDEPYPVYNNVPVQPRYPRANTQV